MSGYASANGYASAGDQYGRRFEEFIESLGHEVRAAVSYVDHVIVPEVRRESAGALRYMALHMERLADRLDPIRPVTSVTGSPAAGPQGSGPEQAF